jgi:hypothetical protein
VAITFQRERGRERERDREGESEMRDREREGGRGRERDSLEECHSLFLEPVVQVILGHCADVPVTVLGGHLVDEWTEWKIR